MRVYLLLLFMCYRKLADYFFANCAVAVAEDVYDAAYRFAYAYAFNGEDANEPAFSLGVQTGN